MTVEFKKRLFTTETIVPVMVTVKRDDIAGNEEDLSAHVSV